MPHKSPVIDRLMSRVVETPAGCWEFTGARVTGYGVLGAGPRGTGLVLAHRATYEYFIADIPPGLHIDHLCRNRACCNPWHVEPVTQAVNNRRAVDAKPKPTHCARGHKWTPENTRPGPHRACLACIRIRTAA